MSIDVQQEFANPSSQQWSDDTTTANTIAPGPPQPEERGFASDKNKTFVFKVVVHRGSHRESDVSFWRDLSGSLPPQAAANGIVIEYEAPDEFIGDPEEVVVSTSRWPLLWSPQEPASTQWSEEKNDRRCQLIDKEIEGTLSAFEQMELGQLQAEMLKHRRSVAPLPLDDLRELHQELLRRTGEQGV